MTDKEKYIRLCAQKRLPLHAQAWWWERSTTGHQWNAVVLEDAAGRIKAAMPYQVIRRFGTRMALMPVHTQFHYAYIADNPDEETCRQLIQALEDRCKEQHIGWIRLQGFYPAVLLDTFRAHGFVIQERVTYRIDAVPAREELPALFSQNKRRQLNKASDIRLADLTPDAFYVFHEHCMTAQGKRIDYLEQWAQQVLTEALAQRQGRLIGAQNGNGELMAAMFLAWDSDRAYYLLPAYDPAYKNSGAVAWLTTEALCIAHDKGIGFDFEGSMTPSIASSYRQFGGKPATYYAIEKFYNPLMRIAVRLKGIECL